MAKYTLSYRTYDQLLSEIQSDFKKYYLEDFINPQEFIKVAKRCNYELGLKIFSTKEQVLEIEKGKAKLPNDFSVLNFALVLTHHKTISPLIGGTHVTNVPTGVTYNPGPGEVNICADPIINSNTTVNVVCNICSSPNNSCNCVSNCNVRMNCDGSSSVLVQTLKYETREWREFHPIRIIDSADVVDLNCPNKKWQARNSAYIKNGFIYPSFKTGNLYINYQGMMEDEDGNLMVPDHDLLNEFYEYAIKQRVLENMIMNGENVSQAQIQIIEQRLKAARNNAYSLVNTPDFDDLRKIWEVNRIAQYHNYYNMFKSF